MKMRQSVAEFERAFHEHTHTDRKRRHEVRSEAIKRTQSRHRERHVQSQFRRFVTLLVVLVATVIVVSWGMFQVLSALMS
jgi:cell division septal protein FtsQ